MKQLFLLLVTNGFLLLAGAQSKFNHKEAFDPLFYPASGNAYRSAGGQPGPQYWQNRADYTITCTLDTIAHKVSGQVTITYTNNSPDDLPFVWLHLDQNIYKRESRGSATTTQTGGRWGNTGFTQGFVLKAVSVDVDGKKEEPKQTLTDTRLQLWLPQPLKSGGGKAVRTAV